ncbi:hypothetical protein ACSBR2_041561 [Camellia fascicularis]
MFETINRNSEIDPYGTNGQKLDDICGDIELRDVYFSYPANKNELIFSGFSLSVPRGTIVALVGQSGCGKSTVINLIERFYDPQAVDVLIDGINVKEFQLRWIRGKIGLVSQEPVLFTSSIEDNITYGKDGATIEEIKVATELANAAKFIDKLPQPSKCLAFVTLLHMLMVIPFNSSGSHSELVQDPKGEFCQLLGLQGLGKDSEQKNVDDQDGPEIIVDSGRHSSQRVSFLRSLSQGSSGIGNSSRHSFSISFGVPTAINFLETTTAEPTTPASATLQAVLPQVPPRQLAYLNKPEIPMLIIGSAAAVIHGLIICQFLEYFLSA